MCKRTWLAILLSTSLTSVFAQDVATDQHAIDQAHTQWIQHVLQNTSNIKPGMTRKSLSHSFEEDGGMQSRSQARYVYKHCRYIKIEVEFSFVNEGLNQSPDDKIIKVSRPYLEYPFFD